MVLLMAALAFASGCQNIATTAANADTISVATPANTMANSMNDNTNTSPPAAAPIDDAPRITLADAKAAFDSGGAIFVDTRAESAYKAEHIIGAVNITQDKLESKLSSLSKEKKIIAYCS